MAGGMSKRGSWGPIGERVNPGALDSAAASPAAETEPPSIRHCWVTDRHGRLPALLLAWRQHEGGWQGRVVRPVREDDSWQVVEEWLPAGPARPGELDPPGASVAGVGDDIELVTADVAPAVRRGHVW